MLCIFQQEKLKFLKKINGNHTSENNAVSLFRLGLLCHLYMAHYPLFVH